MHPDLYAYFSGNWRFTRSMLGVDNMLIGEADGQAEFHPHEAYGLQYKESGRLRLAADQRVVSFTRRFDYRVEDDIVHVAFADGMQAGQAYQSYRYDPAQKALLPLETHLCIADRYDGRYVLIDAGRFDLHTRIEGPQKDYLLHTQFTRAAG
ncbi:DUF6314 family protein [Herbaspirillum rhizosphaerae]|uniref:DUF6314 family protein n=1 Tax=Herbaspirillum rhizosphaerae TaxID=346179 RepID=UPI00067DD046|nr:DUF6314 family protein [Herbaspirillum rhizosphaerae]